MGRPPYRNKNSPAAIDVFSGAGGLSLGAARAGFDVVGAVELDDRAISTHEANFPGTCHIKEDVRGITRDSLLRSTHLRNGELVALLGGPPCQGFSIMGRRASRDPRNLMFYQFMRLVSELRPAFFLLENVPGVLSARYARLVRRSLSLAPKRYRLLPPLRVCASDYGAPTTRTRIIFFGYDPRRLKDTDLRDFEAAKSSSTINVRTALHGLPLDVSDEWLEDQQSWRPVAVTKTGPFFSRAFGYVPFGVGNDQALDRFFSRREVQGNFGTRHSALLRDRYAALQHGEFEPITKSTRLDPSGFCPTLRAGTDKTKGRFQAVRPIHYLRPRVITPREAARLQGLPDWFQLDRTKWHSFRQIGNSVSPILAEALLTVAWRALK